MSDFPHEDWVSSISCDLQQYVWRCELEYIFFNFQSIPRYLLTASYDGHIRVFYYSKNTVASASIHNGPITSLDLVPSPENTGSTHIVATGSHDLTAAITKMTFDVGTMASNTKILATLHLHTAPVSSVSSSSSGTHLLTSSWDGLIGLWDTSIPTIDEVTELENNENERKKRRKIEDELKPRRKAPVNVLKSHTARVSKAVFGSSRTAYSCGFDSTIRTWDTEIGVSTDTIVRILTHTLTFVV